MNRENDENVRRPYTAEELLERIFYYVNALADVKGFNESITVLTGLGRDMVNSDRASFWFWDKRKKQYWTMAALGRGQIVVPEGTGIIGASIANNEVVLINSPYDDPRFNSSVDKETGYVTKSILCIPVTDSKGNVIGAYQAINKLDESGESNFDEHDIKRLSMAAMFCGKTLESQILYMDAQTDQLTGLKNRKGFYEYYNEQITPVLNTAGTVSSVIMCDIDHFKHVNDTYGHNAGDAVLVHVANHLEASAEGIGQVVRWGGEEFIILLPNMALDNAVNHAEQLRKAVEASTCHFDGTDIKVTMSFGVKILSGEFSADKNIELVDANLYQAKETGRNKVVVS
ncbi:MAG: sensor domain-containing diguanylate cyclase [Butyrivibrio sp.]|nr:sensor domain-containing diguanylate cyclase [Butyrivibrio sp.]